MNKKGFTLVELLVSIALISTISYFLFQIIFIVRDIYVEKTLKSELYIESANITNIINKDIINKKNDNVIILGANKVSDEKVDITFSNGDVMAISVDKVANKVSYGTYSVDINSDATIGALRLYYNYGSSSLEQDGIFYVKIPIVSEKYNTDFSAYIYSRYSSKDAIMGGEILEIIPRCRYEEGTEWVFDYTGNVEEFTVPCKGTYKLEVWGASGGDANTTYVGGKGGYAKGETSLNMNDKLYVVVGGQGGTCSGAYATCNGGFNGGGRGKAFGEDVSRAASGGGATHIGTFNDTLASHGTTEGLFLAAAGGGGGSFTNTHNNGKGGDGGGLTGIAPATIGDHNTASTTSAARNPASGTNSGPACTGDGLNCSSFGAGGNPNNSSNHDCGSGGGAGIYGGSSAYIGPGGGGASWIEGVSNATTIAGNAAMPKHDGTSGNMTGNAGNGYAKITLVESSQPPYQELALNGAYPKLVKNLIPVKIDSDGVVKKADIHSEWYNYENQKWANAVILKDNTVSYSSSEVIPESNIDAYFVWIPRYKYKLFNLGNYSGFAGTSRPSTSVAQTIEIEFESRDTLASTGTEVGSWLTHPAFTSFDVDGLWVSKYEISGSTSDIDSKPNTSSLLNVSVGNLFTTMYNYDRDLDSHMLKNTEWGAITYLAFSEYGIDGDVRINNNSNYVTGCAATVPANNYYGVSQSNHTEGYYNGCENAYNTSVGMLASTTGNITGIYDMAGGAFEYVAAYISGKTGSSGLTPSNYASKYFDVYNASSSATSFNYRILGDATGEFGPFYSYADNENTVRPHNSWYDDYSKFVESSNPWFHRGGRYQNGIIAGILDFSCNTGSKNVNASSRLALAP